MSTGVTDVPPVPDPERRDVDRRKRPTPMFSRYTLFGGRRSADRRGGQGTFVDRYGVGTVSVVLTVMFFNTLDAVCTIFFIREGVARELNPVADMLLNVHDQVFIWVKTLGIGAILAFLMMAKNFPAARVGLKVVFSLYGFLALYHMLLLWHHFSVSS